MKFTRWIAPAALAAAAIAATPASAAAPVTCEASLGSFTPAATDCAGWYDGNVLNNSAAGVSSQIEALNALGFDTTGFDFNSFLKIDSLNGSFDIDFGQVLSGPTIIGIHFGKGSGIGNSTGFFLFDLGTPIDSITTALKGSSGVVLYQTGNPPPAVPEPGTWAMMLIGFGAIGFTMRNTRRRKALLAQAA